MPRRYRRRRSNKDKYSIEQTVLRTPPIENWDPIQLANGLTIYQFAQQITPPSDLQGMRKCKHFTLTFANRGSSGENLPIYYALVYVPAGYSPQAIQCYEIGNAGPLYLANQYVISSGVLDFSGGPLRIRSPLARNLNSGDQIALLMATPDVSNTVIFFVEVKYAITLQ